MTKLFARFERMVGGPPDLQQVEEALKDIAFGIDGAAIVQTDELGHGAAPPDHLRRRGLGRHEVRHGRGDRLAEQGPSAVRTSS